MRAGKALVIDIRAYERVAIAYILDKGIYHDPGVIQFYQCLNRGVSKALSSEEHYLTAECVIRHCVRKPCGRACDRNGWRPIRAVPQPGIIRIIKTSDA